MQAQEIWTSARIQDPCGYDDAQIFTYGTSQDPVRTGLDIGRLSGPDFQMARTSAEAHPAEAAYGKLGYAANKYCSALAYSMTSPMRTL